MEQTQERSTTRDTLAVVVWSAGSLLLPIIGWLIGVVLVCTSPIFRKSDRTLALAGPPLGLFAPALLFFSTGQGCSEDFEIGADGRQRLVASTCDGGWTANEVFALTAFLALVALAIYTTVRLARRVAQTR